MKKILGFFICCLPFFATAQHFEVGIMGGVSNYQGDLAPASLRGSFGNTHASFGGFLRYNINNYFATKINANYGKISGDDSKSDDNGRKARNLSFRSNLFEVGLHVEFNILGYQPYNLERVFSPYIFGGIALVNFKPQAELEGEWYDLQPLGTEGQGLPEYPEKKPYKLTEFSLPVGFGLKYALNDAWNIGLEIGVRKTFTDYLDDVSGTYPDAGTLLETKGEVAAALSNRTEEVKRAGDLRGDAGDDDWYFMGGLTISYNFLDNGLVGSRNRSRGRSGCPTF
ncbi:MAG: DUF6089 family protein [Saprospiraceae bacterium]